MAGTSRPSGYRMLRPARCYLGLFCMTLGGTVVSDLVRQIIKEHGRLPVDVAGLDDGADLYQAGMTSHASVNVMLALEDAFDVEFPDSMLKRSVFESVAVDHGGAPVAGSDGRMSVAVDRDQAFLDAIRRIADEVARPNADDVDRRRASRSRRSTRCARQRALSAFVPEELGGGGVSFEAIATACFELGRRCGATAMVFAMHQIQVACIARHLDDAPWFEGYLRERRRRAAPHRVGHLRGRHRR